MTILKTAFDIDGVLYHTWVPLEKLLWDRHGIELKGKERENYRIEETLGREVMEDVVSLALSKEYADESYVDKEAVRWVERLYHTTGKAIPFITSRKGKEDTLYTLDNYIVQDRFPYILVMRDRFDMPSYTLKPIQMNEIGCVAIVEDSPEVCNVVEEAGFIVMLVDREYNKDCNPTVRFTDKQWDMVYHLCMITECKFKGKK